MISLTCFQFSFIFSYSSHLKLAFLITLRVLICKLQSLTSYPSYLIISALLSFFDLNFKTKCLSFRWLNEHAREYTDVTITNVTDEIGTLGIAGPRSREVLSKLTDTDMSHEKFKFLTMKDIKIAGIPVKAMRLSYTGTQVFS